MEFNKFISAGILIASFALVSCGDEKKKEANTVTEVPTNTTSSDMPKTDAPATDITKIEPTTSELPKIEVAPVPESDAPHVETLPAPEAPKSDVTVEETPHHNETKTETTN